MSWFIDLWFAMDRENQPSFLTIGLLIKKKKIHFSKYTGYKQLSIIFTSSKLNIKLEIKHYWVGFIFPW